MPEILLLFVCILSALFNCVVGVLALNRMKSSLVSTGPLDAILSITDKPLFTLGTTRRWVILWLNCVASAIWIGSDMVLLGELITYGNPHILVVVASLFGTISSASAIILWWRPAPTDVAEARLWTNITVWCSAATLFVVASSILFFLEFI